MKGTDVQNVLKKHQKNLSAIADEMGLSRQNLNSKLKGQDLGTIFLLKLSKAAKIPYVEFLPNEIKEEMQHLAAEPDTAYETGNTKGLEDTIAEMKKEIARIEQQLKKK